MASLFEELKRRNVIRVGLVYLFVAWLVVQVADILLESFGTPEWVMKTFIAFLGLGFPIALIFAWAFEITPEGIKKEKDVDRSESIAPQTGRKLDFAIIGLLAAGLIYFAATHDWGKSDEPGVEETAVAAGDERPSIAVLPFVNLSDDPGNEYFSDGLSEELLNVLVRIEGLRVPSRTSSFQYKGTELDMRTIAEQLEVNHVLEGSVRKAGNRVRITAQLIDATTDEHLWSDTYDRELEDIFEIQSDIANQIVAALQSALGGIETVTVDAPTDNLEAYQLYLRGRQLWWQRMYALPDALEAFEEAVELDPEFAKAWAGLAATWTVIGSYLPRDMEETQRQATIAANRAIELDPTLAEGYAVLASASPTREWAKREELHKKALSLDPDDSTTHLWYGILLQDSGYLQEANEQFQYALRLDPAAGIVRSWLADNLYALGDNKGAREHAERAAELGFADGYAALARIDMDRGDLAGARRNIEKLYSEYKLEPACQDEFWAAMANKAVIPVYVECQSGEDQGEEWWWLSFYDYLFLEMAEEALDEIYSEKKDWNYYNAVWPPASRFLRQHPNFQATIKEARLGDFWRKRGDPDLCRSVGDTFECD